jgi:phosphoglycolate phosphatase
VTSFCSDWPERTHAAALERAAGRMRYMLFDFDGPLCRLFANHPSEAIAARLRALAVGRGHALPEAERTGDPHRVIHAIAALDSPALPGAADGLLAAADALLTAEEVEAARSAEPTPHAADLVRDLARHGVPVAVTTNNAAVAVREYLGRHRLSAPFGPHVYGREPGRPDLMKPHPDCLRRAITALAAPPAACLMVGDAPGDLHAAGSLEVPFVGYARDVRKAAALRAAGANLIVASLEEFRAAVARAKGR